MTDHLDDGDLGDLPSIVEEAQLTETPVFKISTSRDDMSEAALAQGFVFQPRQAPKPGQYSGISRPSLSNEAHSSDTSQHLRPAPLRSQEYADVQEPPPAEVGIQIPSNQPQFKHMSSGREQFQGQRSPSKSVITTEDEGHHRVENMLVSTSPMSHHSLLSDNIERAKRDINLVQPLERASSGFSNSSVRSYNRKSCHIADPAYGIGDLERPKPLSPARLRYGQMESIQKFRGSRGPSHSTRAREASHRPESQNSNISRKRSGVEKARAPRKRPQRNEVVEQMMQYWNRVVLITEQEKEQAVNDISDLQDHLAIQSRKFNEVSSLLKERDIEIEDVERDYKKEQERRSHLSDQNKSLAQQVQDLRQQLSDSEKQATHMSEKHTSYKERFDEMMEEQRRHYEETETQYGNLKTFMTEEGLKRFLESQRVEEALRLSIQERADMNNLFNEHQHRISQDMERKNKTLQELENKIALSEMCSQREKGMLEQTIRTMMSMQLSADRSMKDIVNKFEAFTKLAPDQLTTHAKLATQLSNKMDSIVDQIASSPKETQCAFGNSQSFKSLEDNIVARLLPTVDQLVLKQTATEKLMMYHGTSFVSQLSWVQDAMMWMLRRMERIDPVSVRQRVDEGLHQINATVSQAHQACVQMGHRLDTLDTSISEALAVGNCAREAELRKQLGAREAVIEERDRQLQILSDDYANKTQSLSKTILSNSLAAERHVLNALESIQHHLDFEKEREAFKLKIQSNDKINKDLVNQLHETRALLSEACTSRAADDELAKLLSDERLVVSRLSAKVQQLEGEVSMSRELQEKWQLNMETVESLRTRVAAACQRLPRVEIMAAKLDNIVRLNSFIHSTAQYLSKEKVWVQQQLAGRNICEGDPMDVDKKIHTQADHDTQIQQFFTQPFQSETFEDRKVQMRSPGDFGSPSPPPTVQQEQKRRREANRPRSIMRFPRGAEHTASSAEGHPSHGSRGGVSEDIIQEIRAGFTHPDRSESTGKLPAHREMGPNYSRHPGI